MAVLTDKNLTAYKKALDDLRTQINGWTKYLSDAETLINKGTGATFRSEYAKGKKATQNIQSIIDILQSLKSDLNKLISDANAFYTTSYNASNRSIQDLYGCPVARSVEEAINEAEKYSEEDSVIETINIS